MAGGARRGDGRRLFALATIRSRLAVALLVAALPALVLVLLNARIAHREAIARFHAGVEMLRDAVAVRQQAEIEGARQSLAALALGLAADPEDCPKLVSGLVALDAERFVAVSRFDAEGRITCSSIPAAVGLRYGEEPWFRMARAQRAFATGDIGTGQISGRAIFAVVHPIHEAEVFDGALIASLPVTRLAEAVRTLGETAAWLVDARQVPLPLNAAAAQHALPPGAVLRAVQASAAGDRAGFTASSGRGMALRLAAAPLGTSLQLLLATPEAAPRAAAQREALSRLLELTAYFALGLIAVGIGTGLAVLRPLQRLRAAVAARAEGGPFDGTALADAPVEIRDLAEGFARSAGELEAREAELRAALAQRELLMAEIHHRVKNNLQIVSSLLNLSAQRIREPAARAEFEAARDRVRALATLHRHLYMHADHETVDLRAFLEELAGQIFQAAGEVPNQRIALSIDAPSLGISSDQAVPLALVITEAMANALGYAFPGDRLGRLEVVLTADGTHARLVIRDDGIGGGQDRAADRRGVGGQLVRGLARQLGGSLAIENGVLGGGGGTAVTLDFPLRQPSLRAPPALRAAAATAAQ